MKPIDAKIIAEAKQWLTSTDCTDGHTMADYLAQAIIRADSDMSDAAKTANKERLDLTTALTIALNWIEKLTDGNRDRGANAALAALRRVLDSAKEQNRHDY